MATGERVTTDMSNFRRRGEWVWIREPAAVTAMFFSDRDTRCEEDRNRYTYFRRSFELPGAVGSAPVWISTGGRYQLFVNGTLVGRGPDRCHPEYQHVDSYDIAPHLYPGRNAVCVLVHTYGTDMSWYVRPPALAREAFGCGGFFFQGEVPTATEEGPVVLDTGTGGWRFLVSTAWNPATAGGGPGFAEDFSFPAETAGWKGAELDDGAWSQPVMQVSTLRLGQTTYRPFPRMVAPRAAKLIDGEPVRPTRVLRAVVDSPGSDDADFADQSARISPEDWIPESTWPSNGAPDRAPGKKGLVVYLLDFGGTEMGHLFFEIEGHAGQRLHYSYSERLASNGAALLPATVAGISAPPVHTVRLREGRQRFEQFEPAGLRYVELHLFTGGAGYAVMDAGIIPSLYPTQDTGSFDCSEPELTEVWRGAARTVRLCRQDGFLDCPNREQRQWTGDAHVQALFGYMMHADPRPAERMLRQVAETQRGDGMVMMATVCDLSSSGKLFIPDFCLWWLLAFESHFRYTGRSELLEELMPAAIRALRWFEDYLDDDGLLCDLPGWTFIDWSTELDRNGEVTVINALYVAAVRGIVAVARALGLERLTERFVPIADRTSAQIDSLLFDRSRGLYADARSEGKLSERFSQHANAAVVAFGIAPKDRIAGIVRAIIDPRSLSLGRAWAQDLERPFNPANQIVMAQPFFAHIVHAACAMSGDIDSILAPIRERWLPMVRRNGTVWEHWQDTPSTSLCHAFSATPVYDLPTYVVGIRPTMPGFAEFIIHPLLGDLEWAEATVPTPHGDIAARWQRGGRNNLFLSLDVPPGTSAWIEPPEGFDGPHSAKPGSHRLEYVLL
jgi:hypothetical protein